MISDSHSTPVLLIQDISHPFSIFSLDKSNLPPEKSMFLFLFFNKITGGDCHQLVIPPDVPTCQQMCWCVYVLLLFLERGKGKRNTAKLNKRSTTLKTSEELAELLQKLIPAGLATIH